MKVDVATVTLYIVTKVLLLSSLSLTITCQTSLTIFLLLAEEEIF
jgi:hypothetical protein